MSGGRPKFAVWKHFGGDKERATCLKCQGEIVNAKVEKLERHILKNCARWTAADRAAYLQRRQQTQQFNRPRASIGAASYGAGGRRRSRPDFAREFAEFVAHLMLQPYVAVSVDGCKIVNHQKAVNFVLTGPDMKAKLYTTKVTGSDSQTADYMAEMVGVIMDEQNRIRGKADFVTAMVSDNAQTMLTFGDFLERTRGSFCSGCGAHTLNLLIQDILKLDSMGEILKKFHNLACFFLQRAQLLARFVEEQEKIAQRDVDDAYTRMLSLPVATRWHSAFNCITSVIKNKDSICGVFNDADVVAKYKTRKKKQKASKKKRTASKKKRGAAKQTPAAGKRKRSKQTANSTSQEKDKRTITFEGANAIVQDPQFWEHGKKVMKFLSPIVKKIGVLETDGCSIAMVYQTLVDLLKGQRYSNPQDMVDTATTIRSLIEERWKFLHTDAVGTAFLLDPSRDPDDFVGDDYNKALNSVSVEAERMEYSEEMKAKAFREVNAFGNVKRDWTPAEREKQGRTAPMDWWGKHRQFYPALFEIARKIFTIPTSSAAAERSWSTHKYIHSHLQNLLKPETIRKLVGSRTCLTPASAAAPMAIVLLESYRHSHPRLPASCPRPLNALVTANDHTLDVHGVRSALDTPRVLWVAAR